jgi:hypothetical protein
LANRTDFAISRPAVGKDQWRRNSFAGFTCALLIWTLPFGQGLTAQAHGLPQGLHPGTGRALPSWLDPARVQGQFPMVGVLADARHRQAKTTRFRGSTVSCGATSAVQFLAFFSVAESDFALARILSSGGRARQVFG